LWTYLLPSLKERLEDIPANIEFELEQYSRKTGQRVQFNKEARQAFVRFAQSPDALWTGNFRDLSAAITRLCTLADASRISLADVNEEINRLSLSWRNPDSVHQFDTKSELLFSYFSPQQLMNIDLFDQLQLKAVLDVCQQSASMAAAGRVLFNFSRDQKSSSNDSARLQKYLARFGLKWADIHINNS
ncbi:MAG: hypothetical protein K2W88_14735, partial [Pararheinheimera sp.]|nr:hypothetical protein [Rheinheimera sp.]